MQATAVNLGRAIRLRRIFIFVALILNILIVGLEIGSPQARGLVTRWLPTATQAGTLNVNDVIALFPPAARGKLQEVLSEGGDSAASNDLSQSPPGFGVDSLVYIDVIMLFSLALIAAGLFIPPSIQARLQGCVTCILSILLILRAVVIGFLIFAKLLVMVALLLAVPFGTIAYLIIYGSFDRGGAAAILVILMALKLLLGLALLIADEKFLLNIGFVLIFLTSLVSNVIVSFLHGFVPIILVSITDSIAALIVIILAVIWAVILIIFSIVSIIAALRP